jgi:hypothetical protein
LTFFTDGNPGSQLTLTRINYAAVVSSSPTVSIAHSGTNVVLTWSAGTLQQSTNSLAGYADVSGATSPYTNAIQGAQQYFRIKAAQ